MSTPIHLTLVGSNFHVSIVDTLKSNAQQYTYTSVPSFSEYKAPEGHETHVIVLSGHDNELAKTAMLAGLLDQPIVLAFFAPSKELLDALHEAANSLVHVPSIELEDGVPIIIHRRPYDNVISITAGFSIPTEPRDYITQASDGSMIPGDVTGLSEIILPTPTSAPTNPTPEEQLAAKFAESVVTIQLTVKYLLELLQGGRRIEDNLTPPAGTLYYKSTEMAMMPSGWEPGDNQQYKYISRLRVHAYCANARPTDPDFAQNGGIVHVVAVLGGNVARDPNHLPRYYSPDATNPTLVCWFLDSVSYQITPQCSLSAVNGEPQGGFTLDLVTSYDTGFTKTLNLSQSGGDNMSLFTAQYRDTFNLDQFKQKVQAQQEGYNVLVYYDNYYDKSQWPDGEVGLPYGETIFDGSVIKPLPDDNIPLNALFTWTTSSLTLQDIDISGSLTASVFDAYNSVVLTLRSDVGPVTHTLDLSTWD